MKRFALLTLFAISLIAMSAQSSMQLATLFHDGDITTFYNANALKEAYAAAADGDVITLSSGSFAPTNLSTKKVTLRGAGMEDGPNRTVITGAVNLSVTPNMDNANVPMTIEGIYFGADFKMGAIADLTVIKCGFSNITTDMSGSVENCTFLHCLFKGGFIGFTNSVVDFKNCGFVSTALGSGSADVHNLDHCTIDVTGILNRNCNYIECVMFGVAYSTIKSGGGDAYGCVYVGESEDYFNGCSSAVNQKFPSDTQFLKEESLYYELTDEKAAEWLGSDGSQIGMHGGQIPFDTKTDRPQISRFNISSKTSPDGKLAVDIEVITN